MRSKELWIAIAAALSLAGTASASMGTVAGESGKVGNINRGTYLVHPGHYAGAISLSNEGQDHQMALAAATEIAPRDQCRAPEPSKLGLLRSGSSTGNKSKTLCRKLRA